MSDTKYLQAPFELKDIPKDVEETRTLDFIINVDVKDRHKDILNYDNWQLDNFNANPIIGYQHNVYGDNMCNPPNPDDVLGSGKAFVDMFRGKRVVISSATFEPKEENPLAEKVFRKVLRKTLRAASVGIIPYGGDIVTEYNKNAKGEIIDKTNKWPGQELLEWSIVNIPANQEAVRLSMKNHTIAALDFAARILEDFSIKDLKQMKVQEILDAIEKKHKNADLQQLELELNKPDPNLTKYLDRLTTMKKTQN